jgi:hypothetical protein
VIGVDAFGLEHPEFELDVVWVAKHDERSSRFVLHARVLDPEIVETPGPRFERTPIRDP